MDLTSATRAYREKKRELDAAYELVMDATTRVNGATTLFERVAAVAEEQRALASYEEAREAAKEARRVMGNLSAGIGSIGSARR